MAEDMIWQSIETLPHPRNYPQDQWIIVTSDWNKYFRVAVQAVGALWLDVQEHDHTDSIYGQTSATHWMPMIETPTKAMAQGGQTP